MLFIFKKGHKADFEMVMYNADGSRGAMCGNGIRCVARYVYDKGYTDKTAFTIESMGKVKYITLTLDESGAVSLIKVDMGAPILSAAEIPVLSEESPVINKKVQIGSAGF